MITLEGKVIQGTGRSLEKVCGDARGRDDKRQSQSWGRISDRAAKRGARRGMLGWLEQKAIESAIEAGRGIERAAAAVKPKIESASQTALQAAGDISESVAITLLGMSKAARVAAMRNMPHARVLQLLIELEREGVGQSITLKGAEPDESSPRNQR